LTPLVVLLVEDSASDAKLVLQELSRMGRSVEHERVETAAGMRAALLGSSWDVILCDWSLPRFGAPAALALVKELGIDLPFIIVSGTVGEDHAVEAMRAGAHDYVLKERLSRLPAAVDREIAAHQARLEHRRGELARREAEAALLASEQRYRRIVETTNEGVWVIDPQGSTTFMNARMASMLGYSREEVVGLPVATFIAEDHRAQAEEDVGRALHGPIQVETKLLRKDGGTLWTLIEAAPTHDDAGRTDGAFAMVMDVTARRDAEEALRVSETQLRHAQKMEAVGRLAGGIAHDFNNLLSVILGYSDLILGDMGPKDRFRADIMEVRAAGTRAAALTRQLLMFSRQQVIEPRVLDLDALLSGLEKMLRPLVGEDVLLARVHGTSLGRVRADPGSIEQVVMNLAVNARDAMPEGGVLTIDTSNVTIDEDEARKHLGAKPGAYVLLAVRDTGSGMDPATLARIFEPFFTTKEKGKGTGLGLSTVFGIVQQSGGFVRVESEPGGGSTFEILLPCVDAAVEQPPAKAAVRPANGSETILLVEDEDQVREVARGALQRFGYTVLDARDAGEAMLLLERTPTPVHLLLTDIVMPGVSGRELADRLLRGRPGLKVIFMSGYMDDSALRHGIIQAEVNYLQKPLTVESLTRKVREVLDGR
jgi:two-component system, cell cycle sensor histidine kinase and response regulator CckA